MKFVYITPEIIIEYNAEYNELRTHTKLLKNGNHFRDQTIDLLSNICACGNVQPCIKFNAIAVDIQLLHISSACLHSLFRIMWH